MIDFHNTVMGRIFFERQLPDLINAINRLADELHALNARSDSEPASESEDEDHA